MKGNSFSSLLPHGIAMQGQGKAKGKAKGSSDNPSPAPSMPPRGAGSPHWLTVGFGAPGTPKDKGLGHTWCLCPRQTTGTGRSTKAQTSPDPLCSLGLNWAQMRGEGPGPHRDRLCSPLRAVRAPRGALGQGLWDPAAAVSRAAPVPSPATQPQECHLLLVAPRDRQCPPPGSPHRSPHGAVPLWHRAAPQHPCTPSAQEWLH